MALLHKCPCSLGVIGLIDSMLPTVHLDNQFGCNAKEVGDVRPNSNLTTKLRTTQLSRPQRLPKTPLGIC